MHLPIYNMFWTKRYPKSTLDFFWVLKNMIFKSLHCTCSNPSIVIKLGAHNRKKLNLSTFEGQKMISPSTIIPYSSWDIGSGKLLLLLFNSVLSSDVLYCFLYLAINFRFRDLVLSFQKLIEVSTVTVYLGTLLGRIPKSTIASEYFRYKRYNIHLPAIRILCYLKTLDWRSTRGPHYEIIK